MKTRCSNPNRKEYRHYGGRGIVLCPEWHDFATFARWSLASGYGDTKELDRIDNNGRYSPDNCRWATRAENLRNTRQTQLLTAFGETKCVQDWGGDPRCQIVMSRILWRMRKYGWSAERAISTPPSRNGKVPA